MAHCVKNILHGLKGGSYMVNLGIKNENRDKLQTGWDMVQRNITRTHDLVQDLLSYSKERQPEMAPCHPNEIVEEVIELMQAVATENNVTVFWFEAFDEPWKGDEKDPHGAEKHWGLFFVDRTPKLVMQ